MNRDEVYKLVRMKDTSGVIAKNLIGWHGSPTYEASDASWNGRGFECYLCHRTFSQLAGLNQHLSSPVRKSFPILTEIYSRSAADKPTSPSDQQALYHCPNRNGCGKEFSSLAGLMNHLESESCNFTRFENVQRSVQEIVSSDRRIAFY